MGEWVTTGGPCNVCGLSEVGRGGTRVRVMGTKTGRSPGRGATSSLPLMRPGHSVRRSLSSPESNP